MKKIFGLGAAVCGVLMFSGCATVGYGDAKSAKAVSTDFGSSDLQQVAGTMVDSLLSSPSVLQATAQGKPILSVSKVKNKTMQHIDTESITDSIRTQLIKSGQFRFIDRTTDQDALDEFDAASSGLVDPNKAVAKGQQFGAEYLLTANISEIVETQGRVRDVYYKFTMNLKNLKTGLLDWSDEKEIRKVAKRGVFGG